MVVEARVEEMVEEMVGWEAVSHVCGAYFTLKVVVELLNAHSDKMQLAVCFLSHMLLRVAFADC